MNLFDAHVGEGGASVLGHAIPLTRTVQERIRRDTRLTVGVRPEDFHIVSDGEGFPVEARLTEELGADAYLTGVTVSAAERSRDNGERAINVRVPARSSFARGSTVWLRPAPEKVQLFDSDTGGRLA